jgi:pimeloyl-ACP methyl ester carboxylesterase
MTSGMAEAVTTPDGRRLAYLEVGDPHGPLVLHNHGGPSSRLEARLLGGAAAKNGLRFVCVDRPGMGQSSPQKARSYAAWADDLVTIADALGGSLALYFTPAFRLMYAALGLSAKRFRSSFVKQIRNNLSADDQQILSNPEVATGFGDSCAECFAHGSDGLVRDAELLYRRWAFDVKMIERPVHLWQGLDDRLVPDPVNKAVADAMPGTVWHPVEGAGHFVAVGSADDILSVTATELGAA